MHPVHPLQMITFTSGKMSFECIPATHLIEFIVFYQKNFLHLDSLYFNVSFYSFSAGLVTNGKVKLGSLHFVPSDRHHAFHQLFWNGWAQILFRRISVWVSDEALTETFEYFIQSYLQEFRIPVSRIPTLICTSVAVLFSAITEIVTAPFSVNFIAFPARVHDYLSDACSSPTTYSGTPSPINSSIRIPFLPPSIRE